MTQVGFYLMHRGWQDSPIFGRETYSRRDAWVWMIEEAGFVDRAVSIAGKTIHLKRGQFSSSLRFMAKAWDWDEAKVRRFLARAQKEKMIDAATDAGQTVITICNYDEFQLREKAPDAPSDAGVTQQRRGTDANYNKGNKGKESPVPNGTGGGSPDQAQPDLLGGPRPDDPIPDPEKVMFDAGRKLLADSGIPPARAGPMLGKWKRDFGAEAVIVALGRAKREGAIDPIPFIERCLRNGTGNRHQNGAGGHGGQFRDPVFDYLAESHGS